MKRVGTLLGCLTLGLALLPAVTWGQLAYFAPQNSGMLEGGTRERRDEIETDRDSFTPASSIVGLNRTIFESAYSFVDNRHLPETHSLPEALVRYGISDLFELRLGFNYEVGGAENPISGNIPDDFEEGVGLEQSSRLTYGTKIWLMEQTVWLPQSSLVLHGYTPTSGAGTDSGVSATWVCGWELPNRWSWDSALRYSTGSSEDDHFNVWAPSKVLKIPLGDKWKAHAEYFGIFTKGRAVDSEQHFISPGLHYLVTPDLEIGVRLGWGLNDQSPDFFSNVGGGLRF